MTGETQAASSTGHFLPPFSPFLLILVQSFLLARSVFISFFFVFVFRVAERTFANFLVTTLDGNPQFPIRFHSIFFSREGPSTTPQATTSSFSLPVFLEQVFVPGQPLFSARSSRSVTFCPGISLPPLFPLSFFSF